MSPDTEPINVLIVDDEKKACVNLKNLLYEYVDPSLNIVGIAHNTTDAEVLIAKWQPHAVFLDIEMPKENAFHFLNRIAPFNFEVIFVTAYDEYAIKAFKLNAVDYILKPISIEELRDAVRKLKEKLRYKNLLTPADATYSEISGMLNSKAKPTRITIRGANVVEVIDFKDIYFVEASGSYSKAVFLKGKHNSEVTMSSPLSDYEELLPPDVFFRIHRSYLVNCGHIRKILSDKVYSVVLADGSTLPVGRRRYALLLDFLKQQRYYHE